jgi:hypothetical protein
MSCLPVSQKRKRSHLASPPSSAVLPESPRPDQRDRPIFSLPMLQLPNLGVRGNLTGISSSVQSLQRHSRTQLACWTLTWRLPLKCRSRIENPVIPSILFVMFLTTAKEQTSRLPRVSCNGSAPDAPFEESLQPPDLTLCLLHRKHAKNSEHGNSVGYGHSLVRPSS